MCGTNYDDPTQHDRSTEAGTGGAPVSVASEAGRKASTPAGFPPSGFGRLEDSIAEVAALPPLDLEPVAELDAVYAERNAVVVAFARLAWATGRAVSCIPAPDAPGFHIVYVELPTGQVSWHLPDAELGPLSRHGGGLARWDGHDNALKYERLARFAQMPAFVQGRR